MNLPSLLFTAQPSGWAVISVEVSGSQLRTRFATRLSQFDAHERSNCGLYAIRPSRARFSYTGISDVYEGQEALPSTVGLLAHSPEDMAMLCAAHLAAEPWKLDPHVLPLPWKGISQVLPREKLCFAVAWGDELVGTHELISINGAKTYRSLPIHLS